MIRPSALDRHFTYANHIFSASDRYRIFMRAGATLRSKRVAAASMSLTYLTVLSLLIVTAAFCTAKAAEPTGLDYSQVTVVVVAPRTPDIKPFVMAVAAKEQGSATVVSKPSP